MGRRVVRIQVSARREHQSRVRDDRHGPGVQMLTEESLRAGGVVKDLLRATLSGGQREGKGIVVGAGEGRRGPRCSLGSSVTAAGDGGLSGGGGGIPRVMCEAWSKSDAASE